MVLAEWTFLDMLWTIVVFFAFVTWVWLVVTLLADVLRRDDVSSLGKAGWGALLIFLPVIGVFVYIIARPRMAEQDRQLMGGRRMY